MLPVILNVDLLEISLSEEVSGSFPAIITFSLFPEIPIIFTYGGNVIFTSLYVPSSIKILNTFPSPACEEIEDTAEAIEEKSASLELPTIILVCFLIFVL